MLHKTKYYDDHYYAQDLSELVQVNRKRDTKGNLIINFVRINFIFEFKVTNIGSPQELIEEIHPIR